MLLDFASMMGDSSWLKSAIYCLNTFTKEGKVLGRSDNDLLWALRKRYDSLYRLHKGIFLDIASMKGDSSLLKNGICCFDTFTEVRERLGRILGDPIGVYNLVKRSFIK